MIFKYFELYTFWKFGYASNIDPRGKDFIEVCIASILNIVEIR